MKIHKTIKKHAHKVFKHIKTYKHHYMFGLFGTFAIVKMILLAWGIFGVLVMRNTFAGGFDNGLVAYWSLNTNANDYINSNNGTTFNTTSITGKIHNAYDFNGVNAYIEIPNSSTLNITGSITIQAWIKRNSDPILGARRASIVNKGGDNQYRLQHSINNTGFEFAIRTMSGTSFVASTTAPQQDVWYFVVGTYDGSAVKIYVNGVLERSISRTSPIMSNISPVNIGRRATINDRYFDGIIDEVGIWNRSLTASEIASLYNEGAGRSAITQTYTLSYSGGNNGTLSGNSSQTVEEGTNGTMIEAIANSGYHFTQRNDGNITNPRTDSNVHSNISVTAQFTATLVNTYTLSYVSDSNGTIDGTASQTINEGENGTAVTAVANSGYHFTQRSDGSTTNPRTDTNVTGNISVTAQFTGNIVTYTLMYSAGAHGTLSGTNNQTVNQYENGTEITAIPDFGYHFVEWSDSLVANPRTDSNITGNIAVTAQFTGDIKSVAGGLSRLSQDNCPDGDYSASYYDGTCNNEYTDTHNSADSSGSIHHRYSQEFENVYQWAYRHKITTMNTIEKADIDGLIIRSDLAKMLVNYAVKILHRTSVDTGASCSFDDIYNQTREARTYIKLACQMGLMSGESTHFNPNTTITRAEFSTIFSRIVWGSEYNNGSSFTNHLQALKTFGIINNVDNPESTKELRGYIMLMMKRSGDIVNQ